MTNLFTKYFARHRQQQRSGESYMSRYRQHDEHDGGHHNDDHRFFTEFTMAKGILYFIVVLYVVIVCIVFIIELFITLPECSNNNNNYSSISSNSFTQQQQQQQQLQLQEFFNNNNIMNHTSITAPNPFYNVFMNQNPCQHFRSIRLLYLTPFECSFGRRLVASVVLGGIVGWERRQADRPAGIRTMALVSLGSCLFAITSSFAFLDGPMTWDASRIAAAIPSGVGFLGAGLIFKETQKNHETGDTSHVVHGLTTSASLWISAAVGVACAGQLYFCATFSVALILTLLRFGPRQHNFDDPSKGGMDDDGDDSGDDNDDEKGEEKNAPVAPMGSYLSTAQTTLNSAQKRHSDVSLSQSERNRLLSTNNLNTSKSLRTRAALGGIM